MSKLTRLAVLAAIFSIQSNANAMHPGYDEGRQNSHLYATIPGDPLFRIESKPIPKTRAVLTREVDRLSVVVDSRKLSPGAYTVWMRVFNKPELCTGGEGVEGSVCSRGDDLLSGADPSVPDGSGESTSSVFWLTGMMVGDDGVAHVSTSVENNEWPGMVLLGTDAAGTDHQAVWNPLGAEVHIVLRYHGPVAQPGGPIYIKDPATGMLNDITMEEKDSFFLLGRQLNRMLGNCSPVFGEPASNCDDAQLAVFAPPKADRDDDRR
jgi:hypothetical protein